MIMMYEGPHHRVCTFLLLTLLLLDSSIENWTAISDQSENPSIHPSVKKGCHQFCETKQILDSLDYLQDNFIQWWCFPSFWPAWKYLSEEKKLCCWTRLLFFFFSFRKLKPLHCFLQLMYIVHIESGNQKKQYWYYSWKHRQWHVLPTCTKKGSNSNFGRIKLSPCA